ncbi:helix-turn-helix domain-containing protein [Nocardia salmonicida]|uniref:helix-turn-helix domain-containing protein n=1 Tax=Nocardia salmonicida TaxID=53431 RepID=UPI0037AE728E
MSSSLGSIDLVSQMPALPRSNRTTHKRFRTGMLNGMTSELGNYLQARRAGMRPTDVGLPTGGLRRVPGLRREELALLAGLSADYYTRIEQGRVQPSQQILDAIAMTLGLNEIECDHLRRLASIGRAPNPFQRRRVDAEIVRDGVREILDRVADLPAVVMGHHLDALAWTPIGGALLGLNESGERNMARRLFLMPEARELYPAWNVVAEEMVGHLRRVSVERAGDSVLAQLVGELTMASSDFARQWARHDVRAVINRSKAFHHVQAGTFELEPEVLVLPRDQQTLCIYRAEQGTAGAEALALLNTLVASGWTTSDAYPGFADEQR